ncbi:MT-A70 family [Aspergillus vadensis CBS 113365]|uniref:MT-A70-domain-containing protein n=1 Tax=Aspergillus vadensis (strain CBS 113365 / IMI 142717 / IBT 24658) TaxID=1448311 RepID=A0A319BA59_ASPVC|nr:MT-A70-domain-containing protein [Aspergillus vadensis CBS 113365]PYH68821.1 MT-A70-domain-containing protein [Aspergillus vadensis CBS 113365]
MAIKSSILYENPSATAFVIDIPSSIAQAQALPGQTPPPSRPHPASSTPGSYHGERVLLSSAPLGEPYPTLTEPKTEAARARVLERIPLSERQYHSEIIEPLVAEKLAELNGALENEFEWCMPRTLIRNDAPDSPEDPVQGEQIPPGKKRKRQRSTTTTCSCPCLNPESGSIYSNRPPTRNDPPLILSPGENAFTSISELSNTVVKNTSIEPATVKIRCQPTSTATEASNNDSTNYNYHSFYIPPSSHFLRCTIPISEPIQNSSQPLLPGLPHDQKFNLILLDPPWTNRSVRRSGHYQTQFYKGWDLLTERICGILREYLQYDVSDRGDGTTDTKGPVAAIWITNSAKARKTAYEAIRGAGMAVCEEWVWCKVTMDGRPIVEVGGLWRKPYEVLVIGRVQSACGDGDGGIVRRVIAAVPDVHSRKPNLKELFERMFFSSGEAGGCVPYAALEVFARNLTAGWWACGDDVLKFNSEEWWVD